MKILIRGYGLFITAMIIFFMFGGRKIDVAIRTPQRYVCIFDEALTLTKQAEIQSFIDTIGQKNALVPSKLVSCIREQFPLICSVKTCLVPPGCMEVVLSVSKPICKVNTDMLIVPPQTMCPAHWYQEQYYAELPTIFLDEVVAKSITPKNLVAIINQISPDIFIHYRVDLKTIDELWFTDKIEPRFSAVCRTKKIPSDLLHTYGLKVKSLLESKNSFAGRNAKSWLADLRFEKQIILCKR